MSKRRRRRRIKKRKYLTPEQLDRIIEVLERFIQEGGTK